MKTSKKMAALVAVLFVLIVAGYYDNASASDCQIIQSIDFGVKESNPIKFGNMLIKFVLGILEAMVKMFCKFAGSLGFSC